MIQNISTSNRLKHIQFDLSGLVSAFRADDDGLRPSAVNTGVLWVRGMSVHLFALLEENTKMHFVLEMKSD